MLAAALLSGTASGADRPLRIYCVYYAAHGFRAIARDYQQRTGTPLSLRLGCRAHFYPTVKAAKDGDLYLTSSTVNMAKAKADGLLASQPRAIGIITPIIAVKKGNPHNITSLADLGRKGLRVAYPTTCIGNVALAIVAKNKLNDTVKPNMTIRTGNRTGVLRPLAGGQAQAAITWGCSIVESGRKDIDVVPITKDRNIIEPLLIAILTTCRDKARARAFVDYLATDAARKILKNHRLRK